jgi:hypothetical protein
VLDCVVLEAAPPVDAPDPATLAVVTAPPGPVAVAVVPEPFPVEVCEPLADVAPVVDVVVNVAESPEVAALPVVIVLLAVATVDCAESVPGGHSSSLPLQS